MNKKKYINVGIFVMVIAIAAGIAYYFAPATMNGFLGINSAQTGATADADILAIDDISSSSVVAASSTASSSASPVASSAKKSAQKKNSARLSGAAAKDQAQPAVIPTLLENSSDTASGALGDGDATSADVAAIVPAPAPVAATPAVPCSFPGSAPGTTSREMILNEIAWMGSPSSSTAEWMEIKNISPATVALSGWELLDASGKIKIPFSENDGTLAPGGLLVFARSTTTPAAKIYIGGLVNTGDTMTLIDPQCNVSDYLDASGGWPGGNNVTKQTLERDADGVGWHTSALPGGTPGAENSAGPTVAVASPTSAPQSVAPAESSATPSDTDITTSTSTTTPSSSIGMDATDTLSTTTSVESESGDDSSSTSSSVVSVASGLDHVLIAAVQIAGASSTNDFVKIYNPTAAAIDISGWKLHKKSSTGTDYSLKTFPSGSVIAAGQSFVWANSENGFSDAVNANSSSTETLAVNNSVALMDATGTIVDAVAWGTGTNQYGEGPPYPTSPGANQLLSRRSSDGVMADTDNNSNDFTIQ